jgi:hypothetical protein
MAGENPSSRVPGPEQKHPYPEVGKHYLLRIWYSLSVGDDVYEQESAQHADFRTAVTQLASFITVNGGFAAWYSLKAHGLFREPWVPGACLGGTLEGKGVDREFQAGVFEVSERIKRLPFAALMRGPRWLLRLLGMYAFSSPLNVSLSVVKKVAQL